MTECVPFLFEDGKVFCRNGSVKFNYNNRSMVKGKAMMIYINRTCLVDMIGYDRI